MLLLVRSKLELLKTTIVPIPYRKPIETIVLSPKNVSSQPCVTVPHGGPHGAFSTTFNTLHAALALEGCM